MLRARQFRQLGSLDVVVVKGLGKVGDCPSIIWGHEMGPIFGWIKLDAEICGLVILKDSPQNSAIVDEVGVGKIISLTGTKNGGILTHISCMDMAYVRENPPQK